MANDRTYFMLDCQAEEQARVSHLPEIGNQGWFSGARFTSSVPNPLVVSILEGYEDRGMPEYFPTRMLMRQDLVECIQKAGVDNLDVYPAVIRDNLDDIQYDEYCAVNIIGVISCADPARTVFNAGYASRLVDADIDSLVINESKTNGALLFRLAEAVTGVVVHRRVKDAIETAGFDQMIFHDPAEWVGSSPARTQVFGGCE